MQEAMAVRSISGTRGDERVDVRREIPAIVLLVLLALAIVPTFYGSYAFDDSFIGYAIAKNLASGHGFSFNPGVGILTTSAPLAPLVYAASSVLFKRDIVDIAQVVTLCAYLALGPLSYFLFRSFSSRLGSSLAAISLVASPFVVMLWSHESLLCLVVAIAAGNCIIRGRLVVGALFFALATLLRQEALIFVLLSAIEIWRVRGFRPSITFASIAVAPFLCWSAYALVTFGTVFSSTMAVKIAMGENGHFESFLLGVANYMSYCFWLEAPTFWGAIFIFCILTLSLVVRCLEKKPLPRVAGSIVMGSLVTCAMYVAIHSAFFAWFCIPVALVIAVIVALPWSARHAVASKHKRSNLQIVASVSVVALHVLFLYHLKSGSFADESLVGIFPGAQFRESGFVALGKYFDRTLAANDSILYPEPGQLRYYSNRTLIDSQGLTHPGVVGYYRTEHPELTIERYRPTVILEDAHARYPHPPWFDRAYRDRVGPRRFAKKTTRSVFRIFFLEDPAAIPKFKV